MDHYQKESPGIYHVLFFTSILILILFIPSAVSPGFAASSTHEQELTHKTWPVEFVNGDLPEPTPTPVSEQDGDPSPLSPQLQSEPGQASPPSDRGLDPSTLIVNLFDASDLRDPARTLRWRAPLSFQLECYNETYPYQGCELVDDLREGGNWSVKWEGKLIVPENGKYTFSLPGHDDGVRVIIDGDEIVDRGWRYPVPDEHPSPQTVDLNAGLHDIVIDYEQRVPFAAEMDVRWDGPGFSEETLPVSLVGRPNLVSVEFTQAVQEYQTLEQLKRSLDLFHGPPVSVVSNKPAVVRLYFDEVQAATYVEIQFRIPGVKSRTYRRWLPSGCSVEEQREEIRGCRSIDVYFTPPQGIWTLSINTYDIEERPVESHDLSVISWDTRSLNMVPVTVCDRENMEDDYECESGFQLPDYLPLLRSMIPTHDVNVVWDVRKVYIADYNDDQVDEDKERDPEKFDMWVRLLGKLNALWAADLFPEQYYFGMVRKEMADAEDSGGIGLGRGAAAAVYQPADYQGFTSRTVAHETGHLLNRLHTNTKVPETDCILPEHPRDPFWPYDDNFINEVGFDVKHGVPVGARDAFEIMSYCSGDQWVSKRTYRGELDNLRIILKSGVSTRSTEPAWQVTGTILDGSTKILPIFVLEESVIPPASTGGYSIMILDSEGDLLHEQNFEPGLASYQGFGQGSGMVFSEVIPIFQDGVKLVIEDQDGLEVAAVDLTGQPPQVIPDPLPGDQPLTGVHDLQWQVLDPDSEDHTFRVEYIPGDGPRQVLAWGLDENNLQVDFDKLPACQEDCQIKIISSDGVNTGKEVVSGFRVPSKPPLADIVTPETGSLFRGDQGVWLQAGSWDPDDGSLPDTREIWTSNRDGALGEGESVLATDLSEGWHTITFSATDSEGNVTSDAVEILVDGTSPDLELFVLRDDILSSCIDVRIDAFDTPGGSGLASVEYSLDGSETWTPLKLNTLPFQFILPGTGEINISVRAYDHVGNLSTTDMPSLEVSQGCPQLTQPPEADAGGPYAAVEGQRVMLSAAGSSDPDGDITRYEWDLDQDGVYDDAAGLETEIVFGDNGTFLVGLKVTDEYGQHDVDAAEVVVRNLPPSLLLNDESSHDFPGGEAFLGRIHQTQLHEATAVDPGSDDLTFLWNSGESDTYFNDGSHPDPDPSPGGTFPFSAIDAAEVVYADAGLYSIQVEITDDDGGLRTAEHPKLITGEAACNRSQGYWKKQFSNRGNPRVDDSLLERYLEGINYASAYFSEVGPLNDLEQAAAIFDIRGREMRDKAQSQLLAAWLNFLNGSVGWDEKIIIDDETDQRLTLAQVMVRVEEILMNPDASHSSLEEAKDLAESVNIHSSGSPICGGIDGTGNGVGSGKPDDKGH